MARRRKAVQFFLSLIGREAAIDGREHGRRIVVGENQAGARVVFRIVVLHGVFQAADGADDGNRAVFKTVHLIQTAGFEMRRHQE